MAEQVPEVVRQFLAEVAKDPFAMQALADCLADGSIENDGENIRLTPAGLEAMERREAELRREAN